MGWMPYVIRLLVIIELAQPMRMSGFSF